jgi:ABC-type bacteriocin/lantibiotic exporter with double-glycine peptidase domain
VPVLPCAFCSGQLSARYGRRISHGDGDKLVLDGFGLTVERGETCVIIGGSGSGKSTFARLLVGLDRPDAGEIWVDGVDIFTLRPPSMR